MTEGAGTVVGAWPRETVGVFDLGPLADRWQSPGQTEGLSTTPRPVGGTNNKLDIVAPTSTLSQLQLPSRRVERGLYL